MVRKRIEDLVREEAQKSPQSEDDAVQAADTEKPLQPEVLEPEEADSGAATARRVSSTKADLEATVKELKAALQASEGDNRSWQQKTATLQSDLQEQKTVVEKLQVELEQAKQVILKLTESNSVPPKAENRSTLATKTENRSTLATKTENKSTLATKTENKSTKPAYLPVKRIPEYSVGPNYPSNQITDKDIGWVD
jgi:predicted RNase H-like nuclease (RuvC/YqgF family)